jgi:hypothetical protein
VKDDRLYLGHVREAAERIFSYVPPLIEKLRRSFGD